MAWVAFYVGIGIAGLAVLAGVAFRLYRQIRQFMRDMAAVGARLTSATDQITQESATRGRRA